MPSTEAEKRMSSYTVNTLIHGEEEVEEDNLMPVHRVRKELERKQKRTENGNFRLTEGTMLDEFLG